MPDIKTVLSHKARIKQFRPQDLMEAAGISADIVDRVRKNPDYASIQAALSGADAEGPPIILTEGPDGSFHVLTGKSSIVAHFDLDKERAKALIIDDRDSAAVQAFLSRHGPKRSLTAEEEDHLLWMAYQDD
jgi:predicted ABC-type transport system involved in lysophospholipase L1 biosynthesis ATPase subunit